MATPTGTYGAAAANGALLEYWLWWCDDDDGNVNITGPPWLSYAVRQWGRPSLLGMLGMGVPGAVVFVDDGMGVTGAENITLLLLRL